MQQVLSRWRRHAGWVMTIVLAFTLLATCVPVGAVDEACPCCTSDALQGTEFKVTPPLEVSAPPVVVLAPALPAAPVIAIGHSHYTLRHALRSTPQGVPRYLLAATLLI